MPNEKEEPTKKSVMDEFERARKTYGQGKTEKEGEEQQQVQRNAMRSSSQPAKEERVHKVAQGETLSGLSLKYYGSAAREDWMKIYEANKDVIGDNPSLIRAGQELVIP